MIATLKPSYTNFLFAIALVILGYIIWQDFDYEIYSILCIFASIAFTLQLFSRYQVYADKLVFLHPLPYFHWHKQLLFEDIVSYESGLLKNIIITNSGKKYHLLRLNNQQLLNDTIAQALTNKS